jgi:hypothetical protein
MRGIGKLLSAANYQVTSHWKDAPLAMTHQSEVMDFLS